MEDFLYLLRVIYDENLMENVAPIQLGIRLLIPAGSRLLELPEVQQFVGAFDAQSLVFPWRHCDPRMDALSAEIQEIAASADARKLARSATFAQVWQAAHRAAGMSAPNLAPQPAKAVPFLSEPWYCCAEPTPAQFVAIGGATALPSTSSLPTAPAAALPNSAKHSAISADQFV
jgi:hypothetical protein